jgi:serine protease AprX
MVTEEKGPMVSRWWGIKSWSSRAAIVACALTVTTPALAKPAGAKGRAKLDRALADRADRGVGTSRVILTLTGQQDPSGEVTKLGGRLGRRLALLGAIVAELPDTQLAKLAEHVGIFAVHEDRLVTDFARKSSGDGAPSAWDAVGYDGRGIGVAIIDSGVTTWHDDLTMNRRSTNVTKRGQRVAAFVDFVNDGREPYDDNGHGSHVAGIIAGNGYDSNGAYGGVAPGADLVSLKVLDGEGRGYMSDVIAALDWSIAHKAEFNLRVVNLSIGAPVTESFNTDPLTLAAKRAVESGLVVVVAAGNLGTNDAGEPQYGGITAPANAPWVLTVGATNSQGTLSRADDVMAAFSSRGPSAIDFQAKPDVVAPGTGIISLSDPTSHLYASRPAALLDGSIATSYKPYMRLSGTSMAAPVVAGTVALMMQVNPELTPNLTKAILQFTAQTYDYDPLTQGAGFLNAKGAVELARYFADAKPGDPYPMSADWSRHVIWGNYELAGGVLAPDSTAWSNEIVWGTDQTVSGANIVWGTLCETSECDTLVWGTGREIVWGTGREIVWGTGREIVWGTGREIVWGTARNIVWGTFCGGANCDDVVWGTGRNIVWGTEIVWGTGREIVWGTGRNIVWGTARNIVWGTGEIVWGTVREIVWGTGADDQPVDGAMLGVAQLLELPTVGDAKF